LRHVACAHRVLARHLPGRVPSGDHRERPLDTLALDAEVQRVGAQRAEQQLQAALAQEVWLGVAQLFVAPVRKVRQRLQCRQQRVLLPVAARRKC